MITMRYEILKALLDPIRCFIDNPLAFTTPGCLWHMQAEGPESDRNERLNALSRAASRAHIFSTPQPEQYNQSINELITSLETMEELLREEVEGRPLRCRKCKPVGRLMDVVWAALSDSSWVRLSPALERHLERQREKSGVQLDWE